MTNETIEAKVDRFFREGDVELSDELQLLLHPQATLSHIIVFP